MFNYETLAFAVTFSALLLSSWDLPLKYRVRAGLHLGKKLVCGLYSLLLLSTDRHERTFFDRVYANARSPAPLHWIDSVPSLLRGATPLQSLLIALPSLGLPRSQSKDPLTETRSPLTKK